MAAMNTPNTMPKARLVIGGKAPLTCHQATPRQPETKRRSAASLPIRAGVTTDHHPVVMHTVVGRRVVTPNGNVSGPASTGTDLLSVLRGDNRVRPVVDPGLAGGLRAWLEDGLVGFSRSPGDGLLPQRVGKHAISALLSNSVEAVPEGSGPGGEAVVQAIVTALFRQLVTVGRIGNPIGDSIGAIGTDASQTALARYLRQLSAAEREHLSSSLDPHVAHLKRHWLKVAALWLPRTGEQLSIPLSGGNILLEGRADLTVGSPSTGRSSVALVEVKSTRQERMDQHDRQYLALLETLRSCAPPFRVATFYTSSGDFTVDDVSDQYLASCVERVVRALERIPCGRLT
jgi:hypothetical protein